MSNYADALRGRKSSEEQKKGSAQSVPNSTASVGARKSIGSVDSPVPAKNVWQSPPAVGTGVIKILKRSEPSRKTEDINQKVPAAGGSVNPRKSKKSKPSLQKMSLGDVMGHDALPTKMSMTKKGPAPAAQSVEVVRQRIPSSTEADFPALGAPVPVDRRLPARAKWGEPRVTPQPTKVEPAEKEKKASSARAKRPDSSGEISKKKPKTKLPATAGDALGAKPRPDDGGEHELLRLVQEGKIKSQKGRQRIRPRKKKFTTLKKKVLQERLRRWKELHPQESEVKPAAATYKSDVISQSQSSPTTSRTVCLHGFVGPHELEDEDEYNEIMANLEDMARKVGPVGDIFVKGQPDKVGGCPAFVLFSENSDALAAQSCWNGIILGGQRMSVSILTSGAVNENVPGRPNQEWRQSLLSHGDKEHAIVSSSATKPAVLKLTNVISEDDLQDEDCMEETLSDIRAMMCTHGSITQIETDKVSRSVFVTLAEDTAAVLNACAKLDGTNFGGMKIGAEILARNDSIRVAGGQDLGHSIVILENALADEDFEDEEGFEESLSDIQALAERFGVVQEVQTKREGLLVYVNYGGGASEARTAAQALDGIVLGGQKIFASVLGEEDTAPCTCDETSSWLTIRNLLTDDDIEDDECLAETKADIIELASHLGEVAEILMEPSTNSVRIRYVGGEDVALKAAEHFDGMVIGGQTITASPIGDRDNTGINVDEPSLAHLGLQPETKRDDDGTNPMYSGDKLIPERFAECKRVPKIPLANTPRHYATVIGDGAKDLLIEMLGELVRLQRRSIEDKNAKARRRIVMGLRETARGIRAKKVKMVVMANNLDDYGVIDEKLQEILDLARQHEIPVLCELNKRKLGKAVGKNIKIGVVGIQSAEGAHQQFKKLSAMAQKNL